MFSVKFIGGLVIGYVLGTRAGRKQYDKIVELARRADDGKLAQVGAKGGELLVQATDQVCVCAGAASSRETDRQPASAVNGVRA